MRRRSRQHRWCRLLAAGLLGVLGPLAASPAAAAPAPPPLTPQPARPPQTYAPEPVVTPLAPVPVGTTVATPPSSPPAPRPSAQTATSEFRVAYSPSVPAPARTAIAAALDRWAAALRITVPVDVSIDWQDLPEGDGEGTTVGLAGPSVLLADFPGAPRQGTFYPAALANQLTGVDQVPESSDITIVLGARDDWDYATTGPVEPGKASLATVVLHEVVHGLGFTTAFEADPSGAGRIVSPDRLPTVFDLSVVDSGGTSLFTLPDGPALGAALTGSLRWSGPQGAAANAGSQPVLFSPSPYQPGSSVAHLDEATYPTGHPDSVTTPAIFGNEAIYSVGTIAPAMLADMGWALEGSTAPVPVPVIPPVAPGQGPLPALSPVPVSAPGGQPLPVPAASPVPAPTGGGATPSVAPTPVAVPVVAPATGGGGTSAAQAEGGTLPRTGFPTPLAVAGGAGAIAAGAALVRRSQWTRPVSRVAGGDRMVTTAGARPVLTVGR